MVGVPRFVVETLAARTAAVGTAADFVFAGPHGGVLRVTLFGGASGSPRSGRPALMGCASMTFGHGGGAVDRGRGEPREMAARAGHASVSFTLDRHGHRYRRRT
jgi:hypothetical protein